MNSRLIKYINTKDITPRAFALSCGIDPSNFQKMLKGEQPISKKTIEKLSTVTDLNIEWLLTGEGEMLKGNYIIDEIEVPTSEELKRLKDEIEANRATLIPLIPASAFAGSVNGIAPESFKREQCELIVTPVAGAELAIPITGDSMEPNYPDGSIAYIRRINELAFIPWGHTVILDTENGAFIKNIFPDEKDDSFVWAKSINPAYPPMHIPKKSIYRIFRVLGTSRIFTTM